MAAIDDSRVIAILRPDKDLNEGLKQICARAEEDLVQLKWKNKKWKKQEKNVSDDTKSTDDLKEKLATMYHDKSKREQAERRIQSAINRSFFRAYKPKPAAIKKQNKADELDLLKVRFN